MTLVVHWGDGEESIFDGLVWEVRSRDKTLSLVDNVGYVRGPITLRDIRIPEGNSTVYHAWTDAVGWIG